MNAKDAQNLTQKVLDSRRQDEQAELERQRAQKEARRERLQADVAEFASYVCMDKIKAAANNGRRDASFTITGDDMEFDIKLLVPYLRGLGYTVKVGPMEYQERSRNVNSDYLFDDPYWYHTIEVRW